jgi:hypothetical protein
MSNWNFRYASESGNSPTADEFMEVLGAGIDFKHYSHAREYGATHDEAMEAHHAGENLWTYGTARKWNVTHDEAMQAQSAGADLEGYTSARNYGADHEDYDDYPEKRAFGATHDEAMQAHSAGVNLEDYAHARKHATHDEIIKAHNAGLDIGDYGIARAFGATHDEVIKQNRSGADLDGYGVARIRGTHNEVMEAHNAGVDLKHYGVARMTGATHNELMQAHHAGVDLKDYTSARELGATHEEAIENGKSGNLQEMFNRESPNQEDLGPYLGSKHKMNWNKHYSSIKCSCISCLNQVTSIAPSIAPVLHNLTSLFNRPKTNSENKENKESSKSSWGSRYIKEAALDDKYVELFQKFAKESWNHPQDDPRRQAFKEYTSVPLKNGTVPSTSFWNNFDAGAPNGISRSDPKLLDHPALMKVCDEWSDKLAKATNGDSNGGKSYFWPVANHLAELKDYHQSQYQPQLGEGIFEPPSHREQITRRRRQ